MTTVKSVLARLKKPQTQLKIYGSRTYDTKIPGDSELLDEYGMSYLLDIPKRFFEKWSKQRLGPKESIPGHYEQPHDDFYSWCWRNKNVWPSLGQPRDWKPDPRDYIGGVTCRWSDVVAWVFSERNPCVLFRNTKHMQEKYYTKNIMFMRDQLVCLEAQQTYALINKVKRAAQEKTKCSKQVPTSVSP